MCHLNAWEDGSPVHEDFVQSPENGGVGGRWETRIAMLEARIARIEVRLERLEANMLFLRKGMRIFELLFLVTLMGLIYAVWK